MPSESLEWEIVEPGQTHRKRLRKQVIERLAPNYPMIIGSLDAVQSNRTTERTDDIILILTVLSSDRPMTAAEIAEQARMPLRTTRIRLRAAVAMGLVIKNTARKPYTFSKPRLSLPEHIDTDD